MALPTDRNSLVKFCLQKLGAPVIRINIDEEQIEIAVDETLELYKEYHVDGTGKFYRAVKITGSTIEVLADPVGTFDAHEQFIGGISGAVGRFESYDPATKLLTFIFVNRTNPIHFVANEIITGMNSGTSATLIATDPLTLGMMDLGYIPLQPDVIGIIDILKPRNSFSSFNASPVNPFDFNYQLAQTVTINSFVNADLVTYYMFQQDIALWDQLFVGKLGYWHSRKQDRLYIDVSWPEHFRIGEYFAIQFWGTIDPEEFHKVYADKWIRKYLTAIIEEQWGQNLTKYNSVVLPGGITLNGEQIQDRAFKRKEEALVELHGGFEPRCGFKIG